MTQALKELDGFRRVYTDGKDLFTANAAPGITVYGERLVRQGEVEYRFWDPKRSKLAGAILLGARGFGLDETCKVLYLGAASGTTASHVSDIVVDGAVHCVEVSERSFRDLITVCESRKNMFPILADANRPEDYAHGIEGIELVYQDIAQRNQVDIFVRNMSAFDAEHGMLMLKSRSVDVNRKPRTVFDEVRKSLLSKGFKVKEVIDLERYSKDHAAFVVEA